MKRFRLPRTVRTAMGIATLCLTVPLGAQAPTRAPSKPPAPLDSLEAFVRTAAVALPPLYLPAIRAAVDKTSELTAAERTKLSEENRAASEEMRGSYYQVRDANPLVALSSMMRAWYLSTPQYRSLSGSSFNDDVLLSLLRVADAGLMPDAIAQYAQSLIDVADDTELLPIAQRTLRGREVARQAAAMGNPHRYDAELLRSGTGMGFGWSESKAQAYTILGLARLKQGRDAEAQKAFESAHRIAPWLPEPTIGLGQLAEHRGDKAAAMKLYAGAVVGRFYNPIPPQRFQAAYRESRGGSLQGSEALLDSVYINSPEYGTGPLKAYATPVSVIPRRRVLLSSSTALH